MTLHSRLHPDPRRGANDGCLQCYDLLPEPTRRRDVSGPSDSPDSRVGGWIGRAQGRTLPVKTFA